MQSTSSNQPPTKVIPTFTVNNATSYAATAEKLTFPKRDQGLILDCAGDLSLTEYTCAVGDIINPKNVLFASKISNNRVCLYLANKELVDNITNLHEFIQIGQVKVTIRPLISKNKRIIFSNVPANMPNSALENVLDQLNVKKASPVSLLKAAINKEGYSHVASFRRQVYIKPDEASKIPEIFKLHFDDISYFVYAGTDTLKCFNCKLEGHLARNCPDVLNTQTKVHTNDTTDTPQITNPNNSNYTDNSSDNTIDATQEYQNKLPLKENQLLNKSNSNNLLTKRGHSQVSTTDSQLSIDELNEMNPGRPSKQINNEKKKSKPNEIQISETPNPPKLDKPQEDNLERKLISIKDYLDKAGTLLNYAQFKSLLENTYGSRKPVDIILNYTKDLKAFEAFIKNDVYPNVRDSSIKNRCTRLLNNINKSSANATPEGTPANSDTET